MKTISIDEDVHSHLLRNTVEFGESPSSVLRRLLGFSDSKKNVITSVMRAFDYSGADIRAAIAAIAG